MSKKKHAKIVDKPARSICRCDHLGDNELRGEDESTDSKHAGLLGHGPCMLCGCVKFTWKERRT